MPQSEPPEGFGPLSEEQRARIERRVMDLRAIGREGLKITPWLKLLQIAVGYLEDVPALLVEIRRLRDLLAARGGTIA